MPRGTPLDLTCRRFGRLTVLRKTPLRYNGGNVVWECECEEGNIVYVSTSNLTTGRQMSCGCYQKERHRIALTTHGMAGTKYYRRFRSFLNNHAHEICARWRGRNGVVRFYEDMGIPEEGAQLQRHDTSKPYSKRNCYWGTRSEKIRRAKGVKLTYKGESRCIVEWAEILGVSRQCVQQGGEPYLSRKLSQLEEN